MQFIMQSTTKLTGKQKPQFKSIYYRMCVHQFRKTVQKIHFEIAFQWLCLQKRNRIQITYVRCNNCQKLMTYKPSKGVLNLSQREISKNDNEQLA